MTLTDTLAALAALAAEAAALRDRETALLMQLAEHCPAKRGDILPVDDWRPAIYVDRVGATRTADGFVWTLIGRNVRQSGEVGARGRYREIPVPGGPA